MTKYRTWWRDKNGKVDIRMEESISHFLTISTWAMVNAGIEESDSVIEQCWAIREGLAETP